MRIGLVVTGGVDRSGREFVIPALLWLIERLARRHDLFVYVLRYHRQPCSYPLLGATIRDLGSPDGIRRQTSSLMRALRADGRFDVIHAYWALPAGLAAGLAARRLRVPAVLTCDSGEFVAIPAVAYGLQRRARQRLAVAAAVRLAHVVTVCSDYQRQLAATVAGIDPEVLPIGVDTGRFTPDESIADAPPRLIHVANLNPVKDQATLLGALQRMRSQRPEVHLDLVGLDTLDGRIQALAASLGVADAVTFHGFLNADQLIPLYQRSHLALLSSRHEAAGVATLEAAACGVATVGTDVGYVHDWMPDRAVAVPVADPDALAGAALDLLADSPRRAALVRQARSWTLAHDADWTARAFEDLYARVAGAGRHGHH